MTQDNTVNVKFSNSQLDELKSGIKIGNEVTLKLSTNIETLSFSHCTKKKFFFPNVPKRWSFQNNCIGI